MTTFDLGTAILLAGALTLYALALLPIRRVWTSLRTMRRSPQRVRYSTPDPAAALQPFVPPSEETMPVAFVAPDADPDAATRRDLAHALYLDLRQHPEIWIDAPPTGIMNDDAYYELIEGRRIPLVRPRSDADLQALSLDLAGALLALRDAAFNGNRAAWISITPTALAAHLRRQGLPPPDDALLERAVWVTLNFSFQRAVDPRADDSRSQR
jgi:hypothetical protein